MKRALLYILSLLGLVILLEIIFFLFIKGSTIFPAPHSVLLDLIENKSYYLKESLDSFKTILKGFIPAIFTGYLLAFLCFHFSILNLILKPLINLTQLVPKTALIPVFVSISFLGYGQTTKVLITFLISYFPVFIEVYNGLTLMNNKYLMLFKSNYADSKMRVLKLEIPFTIPHLINGIKISILYSVLGAITSEIIIGGNGIGYLIEDSSSKLNFTRAFGGITICILIGFTLISLFTYSTKTLLKKYTYGI